MIGIVPEGYVTLRDAIQALAQVQYAGHQTKEVVTRLRRRGHEVQFTLEELEASARYFWSEADAGQITIFAEQPSTGKMIEISPTLLSTVPFARRYQGSTLDYLRPTNAAYRYFRERFGTPLGSLLLLVKKVELERAAKKLRVTRKRKEKPTATTRRSGRPSKQKEIKDALVEIVESRKWRAVDPLKKLTNLVRRPPYGLAVSYTTVGRALDDLCKQTGDRRFQRLKKAKRRPLSPSSPQKA